MLVLKACYYYEGRNRKRFYLAIRSAIIPDKWRSNKNIVRDAMKRYGSQGGGRW